MGFHNNPCHVKWIQSLRFSSGSHPVLYRPGEHRVLYRVPICDIDTGQERLTRMCAHCCVTDDMRVFSDSPLSGFCTPPNTRTRKRMHAEAPSHTHTGRHRRETTMTTSESKPLSLGDTEQLLGPLLLSTPSSKRTIHVASIHIQI